MKCSHGSFVAHDIWDEDGHEKIGYCEGPPPCSDPDCEKQSTLRIDIRVQNRHYSDFVSMNYCTDHLPDRFAREYLEKGVLGVTEL